MYRYEVYFYNNQEPITTYSVDDNRCKGSWSKRYIQLIGFTKGINYKIKGYSFWDLNKTDLSILKGCKPVLIRTNGITKILSTTIREVRKVKI